MDRIARHSTNRKMRVPGYRDWIRGAIFFSLLFVTSPGLGQENIPALVKKTGISIAVILNYDQQGKALSQGTGFFLNKEGDLITNYHVLQGASRSEIRLSDGRGFPVKEIVAEDQEGDLMRVSVDIPGTMVHPLPISPTLPEVGEKILVIGTPLGLEQTVSDGIVSSIREIPGFGKMVQMTAPISPGSSGSPVLNMKGEVVGVATFLIVFGQNLNFAIPAERITKMRAGQGSSLSDLTEKERKEQLAQATELYATGLRFVWAQKYEMALPFFIEAVQKDPNYAQAYFQIGYCLATLGKHKEAIEPYQKALELKPKDPTILNNLCAAYGKSGRYGEAARSCQKAIELKPDLAEAHNNLGWTYHQMGRHQEAIQSCKAAIRLQPDLATAHYNMGNGYAALKSYEEAVESYKQAIRLEFDYAEAHLNLGAAYHELGRYEEAIDSYKRALLIKPSLPEGHLNLGMTYLRTGNRGSAIEAYKILKDLNPEMGDRLFALIYE
jgi:tetratricopeptide (TPR) repeat protein